MLAGGSFQFSSPCGQCHCNKSGQYRLAFWQLFYSSLTKTAQCKLTHTPSYIDLISKTFSSPFREENSREEPISHTDTVIGRFWAGPPYSCKASPKKRMKIANLIPRLSHLRPWEWRWKITAHFVFHFMLDELRTLRELLRRGWLQEMGEGDNFILWYPRATGLRAKINCSVLWLISGISQSPYLRFRWTENLARIHVNGFFECEQNAIVYTSVVTFCLAGLLLGLENEFAETVKAVKVVVDGV